MGCWSKIAENVLANIAPLESLRAGAKLANKVDDETDWQDVLTRVERISNRVIVNHVHWSDLPEVRESLSKLGMTADFAVGMDGRS